MDTVGNTRLKDRSWTAGAFMSENCRCDMWNISAPGMVYVCDDQRGTLNITTQGRKR
jgi:hypothetical protein